MATQGNNARVGVVLAAGMGVRLASQGASSSVKPLIQIHGVPLLLRTLRSLETAGRERIVVVIGHQAETVRRGIENHYKGPMRIEFAYNHNFTLQNGISVLCARPFVDDEFVLTMADHILDDDIMRQVSRHHPPRGGATLCVDYKVDEIFDIDDATKVLERNGSIVAIGKRLQRYNCIDTGVFVATPALMDAIEQVFVETGDASLSNGIALLAASGVMNVLDIGDAFWQDVDTPEMLAHAEENVALAAAG